MKNKFHKLRVIEKTFLTADAVMLTLELSDDLKTSFEFLSGQYLVLKAQLNGIELRRSYSICSSPGEQNLSIVVKAIEGGVFSNYIKELIKVHDYLEVNIPEGRFTYQPEISAANDIVLIAAGSGITPIISMLKNIIEREPLSRVTLIYANRNTSNIIFFKQLELLKEKAGDNLRIIHVLSREENGQFHFGRLDDSFISKVLSKELDFLKVSEFYSCGPEAMVQNMYLYLESLGIPKHKMKSELFYSAEDVGLPQNSADEGNQFIEVEVIINDESHHVSIPDSVNILQSLLELGLDVPYSCKKGNCSSCVGKVISGSVNMKPTDVLMDYEISDGFILSCQSLPDSPQLTISYDEY